MVPGYDSADSPPGANADARIVLARLLELGVREVDGPQILSAWIDRSDAGPLFTWTYGSRIGCMGCAGPSRPIVGMTIQGRPRGDVDDDGRADRWRERGVEQRRALARTCPGRQLASRGS